MGYRLSKIYTRTGDKGTTGLADGNRISKNSQRILCLGGMEEINATIGLVRTQQLPPNIDNMLGSIQHHLFDLGGEMAMPDQILIKQDYVTLLENWLDTLNETLSPLKEFILPGGCVGAAYCHLARTICRRVEIEMVALSEDEMLNPHSLQYINRLSDFLFVCSRSINQYANHKDVLWKGMPGKNQPQPDTDE